MLEKTNHPTQATPEIQPLLEYLEEAKKAAISAGNSEAIDCLTDITESVESNCRFIERFVVADIPANEAYKKFGKIVHELMCDSLIVRGVEVGQRNNSPSDTLKEAVQLVLGSRSNGSGYWYCPYSADQMRIKSSRKTASSFFRSILTRVHEIEADERMIVKSIVGKKTPSDIDTFCLEPTDSYTILELQEVVDKLTGGSYGAM